MKTASSVGQQSVGLDLVEDLLDALGILTGLLQQAGLAELDQKPFGAGRDQAGAGSESAAAAGRLRTGNLHQFQHAGAEILYDLFHDASFLGSVTG